MKHPVQHADGKFYAREWKAGRHPSIDPKVNVGLRLRKSWLDKIDGSVQEFIEDVVREKLFPVIQERPSI